ncbi:hypothetical protein F4820DRAFT_437019 [Hypoxylon rubiginosum]|uniref:Uncharacterized protein n=1 Tax=Hypoxylon rubiginosum TaxID=110542 RepID=A0ACB9YMY3_9PEZI|nr:hypothetical protein F4820DRAFT_437019 [Hypoxylon rubiginosum]
MESPSKRLKLGQAPYDDDDDDEANQDELSMSPTQFDARQNPLYELDKGRAKAATRLKSAFERIFEKYERDFTGVGDEIDLETGEVVVDNGHLQSLEDEKVRARQGSILSNAEEKIAKGKGKDVGPVAKSKSKSLAKTTSSTHQPARPDRIGIVNGTHRPLSSSGMPSNPYGSTHPVMFEPPRFGNGPSDPLWQTPEIPIPHHQDMYGFMGQAMGYPPPPGYGYAPMLAPGGGYGTALLNGPARHRVSTKFPHVKTSKRQSQAPVVSIEDDSEEDDVLSGNTTKEVQVAGKDSKPATSSLVEKRDAQVNQKDAKQNPTIVFEHTSQKPRRGPGRPRKGSSPAKAQGPIEETAEICTESRDVILRDPTPEPTDEAIAYFAATSISQPPTEEESTLAKQIVAKLARMRASIPDDTASLYSQSRESSQSRKQVEIFSEISREPSSETNDTQTATEMTTNDISKALSERIGLAAEDVISYDCSHEGNEAMQPDSAEDYHVDEETVAKSEDAIRNQGVHDEPPMDQSNYSKEQSTELDNVSIENSSHTDGDAADLFFTAENSREPETSYSNQSTTKEPERLSQDKEVPSHNNSGLPGDIQDLEVFHTPQDNEEDVCSNQGNDRATNLENYTAKDTDVVADAEVISHDLGVKEVVDTPEEPYESNITPNCSQEAAQSPPLQIESDETDIQSSGIQQREETPPISTTETQVLPDNTEGQMQVQGHPECGAGGCRKPPSLPTHEPESVQSQSSFAERIEVALRPLPAHNSPSSEYEQAGGADPFAPPECASNRRYPTQPNPSPVPRLAVPSTPRKPRESSSGEPGSRHRLSTPAKKKYRLANLVPDTLEDEDELSVLSSGVSSSPLFPPRPDYRGTPQHRPSKLGRNNSSPVSANTPRKTGRRHGFLMSSGSGATALTPQHRAAKHPTAPATDSRALSRGGNGKRRFDGGSGPQSSPLARTVANRNTYLEIPDPPPLASTPSWRRVAKKTLGDGDDDDDDGVRTPGGTVRRCGVDGFVCDRDFCFTCCR